MELLKDVELEFVKIYQSNGSLIFTGKKDGHTLILIIKIQYDKDLDTNEFSNFSKTFDNQRYYKFEGITKCDLSKEITIIYPALEPDIRKYGRTISRKIIETPQIYQNEVYPGIINQDLGWIHNIFTRKSEVANILYDDEYFVLLPDMKWDGKAMDQIYCLAILKDGNIRSIRDITDKHVRLLEHINRKSLEVINKTYHVDAESQFRSYFHYRPSFWHAHIHFNLITNKIGGAMIDVAYSVHSVIQNVKIKPDYYQVADLEVIEKEILD